MHLSLTYLLGSLIFLIILSAFFSASETGMMALNRYRLRHLVRHKHKAAKRAQTLLERPDRLLGVILIGNTFATILASAIATLIATRIGGEAGVAVATVLLTFVMLIFSEMAPKTLAAIYPQRVAFLVSVPLLALLRLFYPLVWLANSIANGLLKLFGINLNKPHIEPLSVEEFRTVVHEAGGRIPVTYQEMFLKILDMEKITVDDIMIPRNDIFGIDIEDDWENVREKLINSQYTRLLVYTNNLDQVQGILHLRDVLNLLAKNTLTKDTLLATTKEAYYILEGTPLITQLMNFREAKCRSGLVVDEYGDIQGLATLEDILEEIVGEFTTDIAETISKDIHQQSDGSYMVDGSVTIRELNRSLNLNFPTTGPKTLSGLIVEYLEAIPQSGTSLLLSGCPIEIIQTKDNMVKTAKIWPQWHKPIE